MRVDTFGQYQYNTYNIEQVSSTIANQEEQISSGRKFNSVSQNPQAAGQELIINEMSSQLQEYQKSITAAQGYLSSEDSIFGNLTSVLQDVQNKATEAANGTMNSSDLTTISNQVNQDIKQVVTLANTKYLGNYIFSGSKTTTAPYTYNGTTATYNGDANASTFQISPTMSIPIAPTGDVAFQSLLNSMINLKTQISSGNSTNIETALSTFKTQMNNLIDLRSQIGAQESTLSNMNNLYTQMAQSLASEKSTTVDTNMTKALSSLNAAQLVYQATLDATVKTESVSILKYL